MKEDQEQKRNPLEAIKQLKLHIAALSGSKQFQEEKIQQLLQQLFNNQDKVAQFCKSQLAKQKDFESLSSPNNIASIPTFKIDEGANCYFSSELVQNNIPYTYLRAGERIYMFNHCFIPAGNNKFKITAVLSQTNIQSFLSYFQLCQQTHFIVEIITVTSVWVKLSKLVKAIWGQYGLQLLKNRRRVQTHNICRLFEDEIMGSFDYHQSNLIFKRNLWENDSYDVLILLKGKKYLIECDGLKEDDSLHAAWRKDIVKEEQYCRLIDRALFAPQTIYWKSSSHSLMKIEEPCMHYINEIEKKFITFANCCAFTCLPLQLIEELYESGEIVQYCKGQIIYKSGMKLQKFYVLIEGQLQATSENIVEKIKDNGCFDIDSFTKNRQKSAFNLTSSYDKSLVFSIDVITMKYVLGHFQETLISTEDASLPLYLPFSDNFGEWTLKSIIYNSNQSKGYARCESKLLGKAQSPLRVSNQFWKELCYQDIRVLFATHFQPEQE